MPTVVPHTWPLRPWHEAVVAGAVAIQVFAIARVSPWFPQSWCAGLAAAVGLAWLPPWRGRSPVVALGLRVALVVPALLAAGAVIGELVGHGLTPSHYPRSSPPTNLVAAALWLCALHAPVTLMRWWVRAAPAQDAGLELAESTGASLTAVAVVLTVQNAPRAWSLPLGTYWSTAACLAVGLGLLAGAWIDQARRWRWLRRVRAGLDPAWRLVGAEAPSEAPAWTHAADGEVLPEALARRSAEEEHYRVSAVRIPVAGVGRTARAWWTRRALSGFALGWAFVLTFFGMQTLLHIWSDVPAIEDPAAEVQLRIEVVAISLATMEWPGPDLADRYDWGWRDERGDGVTFHARAHTLDCYAAGTRYVHYMSGEAAFNLRRALDDLALTRGWAPPARGWSLRGIPPFFRHEQIFQTVQEQLCRRRVRLSGDFE